jgi:hypothetical protein
VPDGKLQHLISDAATMQESSFSIYVGATLGSAPT